METEKPRPERPAVHIDFLNRSDIEKLALTDSEILDAVGEALVMQGEGRSVIGERTHLHPEAGVEGHFNVLRGWLGGDVAQAGVKVVGDFYDNYRENRPSEYGLLALFDPRTGAPRGGARRFRHHRYAHRRGDRARGSVSGRHGGQKSLAISVHAARATGMSVSSTGCSALRRSRVHSRRAESREAFAARLEADLGKPVAVTEDWRSCVEGADIVVEASRLARPEPLLKTAWIRKGALVIPYGTKSALEDDLTDIMDKIVVDDWGQARAGSLGALRAHVDSGRLSEETLHAELGEIAAGRKPGREREEETILFWHRGMSLSDIALGHAMLGKAARLGIGQRLRFC